MEAEGLLVGVRSWTGVLGRTLGTSGSCTSKVAPNIEPYYCMWRFSVLQVTVTADYVCLSGLEFQLWAPDAFHRNNVRVSQSVPEGTTKDPVRSVINVYYNTCFTVLQQGG